MFCASICAAHSLVVSAARVKALNKLELFVLLYEFFRAVGLLLWSEQVGMLVIRQLSETIPLKANEGVVIGFMAVTLNSKWH